MKSCLKGIKSCLREQEESRNLRRDLKYYKKKFQLLEKIK
jgi:hypothetical protein